MDKTKLTSDFELINKDQSMNNNSKKETFWSIIKSSFENVCSNTTAHAIPNIFRTEYFILKGFWFILLLGGSGASIYYFYYSLKSFFEYPISVSVNAYEEDLETFPAVTICNINPFDSSDSSVLSYLENQLRSNNIKPQILATADLPSIYLVRQAMKILKASVFSQSKSNNSFAKRLSYSLDSMLISCYFNGVKCNSSDFTDFYSFDYGNCYTFNKKNDFNTLKSTSKTGPNNGLSLEIFTGYPGMQDFFMEQRGLYLAVHNNSVIPSTKYEGIKIPVGFSTDVSVKRTIYERLSSPYSECIKDSEVNSDTQSKFVKATVFSNSKYSKKACFETCLQNLFIEPECNCSDPSILYSSNQKICKSLDDIICVDKIRDKFDSTDLSDSCKQFCPIECDRVLYETSICMSDYPTTYYYNIISKQPNLISKFKSFGNVSYSTFKESVLMVNVFYQELVYTGITESPTFTPEQLLGIIGGQIGLFMGCSVLTFFEPFEFIIDIICKLIKLKKVKNI